MTSAASEVQKAIFGTLVEDASVNALVGARVYDRVPETTPFPYLTFGRTGVYDWSTGTEIGTEQIITLHAWSKAKGNKEALELIEAVRARLEDATLPLAGHVMVNLRLEYSEVRFDEDLAVHHGLVRFRVVTEQAD